LLDRLATGLDPKAGAEHWYQGVTDPSSKSKLKLTADYGKQPLVKKDQFYTRKELDEISKQKKLYNETLKKYNDANPQSGASEFFSAFTGNDPYMNTFHNLHPNLKNPSYADKFTDSPFLMKYNRDNTLKYPHIKGGQEELSRAAKDLMRKNDWHLTDPGGYLREMRGLSEAAINKMSEKEISRAAKKINDKLQGQILDRYKKEVGTPFTGKQAFKTLTPNKYGGQVGWLDKYK